MDELYGFFALLVIIGILWLMNAMSIWKHTNRDRYDKILLILLLLFIIYNGLRPILY